jgi:hypothetical protein
VIVIGCPRTTWGSPLVTASGAMPSAAIANGAIPPAPAAESVTTAPSSTGGNGSALAPVAAK